MKERLDYSKININWNKNPIRMETFLSFLTVPLEKSTGFLGESTGWTQRVNKELKLTIMGGFVQGQEWLNSIEFGIKTQNIYNNHVNPFYLFDIMNKQGKSFFIEYYKTDINAMILKQKASVEALKEQLKCEKQTLKDYNNFVKTLDIK